MDIVRRTNTAVPHHLNRAGITLHPHLNTGKSIFLHDSYPFVQLQRRRSCADLKIATETHLLLHSNIKDITMVRPLHPEITQGSSTMLLLLSARLRQITINRLEQDTCLPIVSRVISPHSAQHQVS